MGYFSSDFGKYATKGGQPAKRLNALNSRDEGIALRNFSGRIEVKRRCMILTHEVSFYAQKSK